MTYVYEAAIKPDVAEKITSLGDVNEVLTIEKQGNLNIISDLSNAVSLKDVLNLKEYCRFVLKDCKILVADVVAGISTLHAVNLQRNKFSLEDILLVQRRDTFYFQIAGIENCTCIDDHEPTNNLEMKSFQDLLTFVAERLEEKKEVKSIRDLSTDLEKYDALNSDALYQARTHFREEILSYERQGLKTYVKCVQAVVTPVGEEYYWNIKE